MSLRTDDPTTRIETFQVYRRFDGTFARKLDRAALGQDEMLIGRGLTEGEASELIEEFNGLASSRGGVWS